jgi:hypothetical protein
MSKLVCVCGKVISDLVYPSLVQSYVFSETSLDRFIRNAGSLFAELKNVDSDDSRVKWLREHFGVDYPMNASDSDAFEDALSQKINDFVVSMLRCENCGRLHIQQKPGENLYSTYSPDDKRN